MVKTKGKDMFFKLFDDFTIRVEDKGFTKAVNKFCEHFKHYQIDVDDDPDVDLCFYLGKFQPKERAVYRFENYAISENYMYKKCRHKFVQWGSEHIGYGELGATVNLDGGFYSESMMVPISMNSTIQWMLSLKGFSRINAAALQVNKRGVLLIGRRGVGKTLISASLMESGAKLVSEDMIFLKSGIAHGLHLPINIKHDRPMAGFCKISSKDRLKLFRNRLLSYMTGGYISLLHPYDLYTHLGENIMANCKVDKIIHLQVGARFNIDYNLTAEALAELSTLGNKLDEPWLVEDFLAFSYACPGSNLLNYWNKCKSQLLSELEGRDIISITVPSLLKTSHIDKIRELIL